MTLNEWAVKWGIPYAAISDLRKTFLQENTEPTMPKFGLSESAVQNQIRLEASRKGKRVWRNNVGACMDSNGNFIRYGLANDSQQMNDRIKSSDLIGISPVTITQSHVGMVIGQFIAREVKHSGWQYSGTHAEIAQLRFLNLVLALGGDAAFATSEGTL